MRLRLGALTRRIEHHRAEGFQFVRRERAAEQVTRLGFDWLEARRLGGLTQGGDGSRIGIGRDDARALGQPQRERADAAKQVGNSLGIAGMLRHQTSEHRLAFLLSPAGMRPAAARPTPCPCGRSARRAARSVRHDA